MDKGSIHLTITPTLWSIVVTLYVLLLCNFHDGVNTKTVCALCMVGVASIPKGSRLDEGA